MGSNRKYEWGFVIIDISGFFEFFKICIDYGVFIESNVVGLLFVL